MKKLERISNKIDNDKELSKAINKEAWYFKDQFINDGLRYVRAIKENRMICNIASVSNSGMSRTIKFLAPEKNKTRGDFQYFNYFSFMRVLGFKEANSHDHYFRISGCGMDMIFHTNYTIIHKLASLGFISDKECRSLAQNTPTVI